MDGYAFLDSPRCGVENMALDQRILELSAAEQVPVLRVYRWAQPTLSLGYFQKLADRDAHAESADLMVVRRSTGGGAIVHHHDWTYCVTVPAQLTLTQHAVGAGIGASQPLYDCLHDCVVGWLTEAGFPAHKWSQACSLEQAQAIHSKRFLCFERRSCGDVVVGNSKVMGSAQRRMQGALLQHGSLLLASSIHAPSLLGLHQLAAKLPVGEDSTSEIKENAAWISAENTGGDASRIKLESWFQCLTRGLESATGIRFQWVESLTSLPFEWSWPKFSKYNQSDWTARI